MQVITSKRVLYKDSLQEKFLFINSEGTIEKILDELPTDFTGNIQDYDNKVIMPGIVDTHVHINEPGRTDWEGFNSATLSAAAGGITTLVDMPLNCLPVTTTKEALEIKLREVKDQLWVDCGFWGGVVPESVKDLEELLKAGVLGVKSFLIDSGIQEFPPMDKESLPQAMNLMKKYDLPYLIHAELEPESPITITINAEYNSFLHSRPRSFENDAIELMIDLMSENPCHVHIVHLSSSDALDMIIKAKDQGKNLTVETCPHYLEFFSEEIEDGKTLFKCCPPIREKENREKLWQAIKDKAIDFIVSDHSPCTANLKLMEEGDLDKAWGGISSLQFSLQIVWTQAKDRGFDVVSLSKLMSQKTAEFIGMKHKKGSIEIGLDADFVVWSPEESFVLDTAMIHHKNKQTPYLGKELYGTVHSTYLRGKRIYHQGNFCSSPFGQAILKNNDN